jgi:hypothetical protein
MIKWYRYDAVPKREWITEDRTQLLGVEVFCTEYTVQSETPCGVWLSGYPRKWVSNTARRRFAYPTKELALDSFRIRNARRISYLKRDLKVAGLAKLALDKEDLYQPKQLKRLF